MVFIVTDGLYLMVKEVFNDVERVHRAVSYHNFLFPLYI